MQADVKAQAGHTRKVSFRADWTEAEAKGSGAQRDAGSTELSAQMSGGR